MSDDIQKANEIAAQVATAEMVKLLVAYVCRGPDATSSKANLAGFEETVVNSINGRRLFPDANDATETYIKEAAAGYVSRIVASISVDQ